MNESEKILTKTPLFKGREPIQDMFCFSPMLSPSHKKDFARRTSNASPLLKFALKSNHEKNIINKNNDKLNDKEDVKEDDIPEERENQKNKESKISVYGKGEITYQTFEPGSSNHPLVPSINIKTKHDIPSENIEFSNRKSLGAKNEYDQKVPERRGIFGTPRLGPRTLNLLAEKKLNNGEKISIFQKSLFAPNNQNASNAEKADLNQEENEEFKTAILIDSEQSEFTFGQNRNSENFQNVHHFFQNLEPEFHKKDK